MIDWVKLFKDYGLPYTTKSNKGWTNIDCPYCADSGLNGGFNDYNGAYNCWKCGKHNPTQTIALVCGITVKDVKEVILQYSVENLHYIIEEKRLIDKLKLPNDTLEGYAVEYLNGRGFDPSYLNNKYGVVSGGVSGKWKYRVIIPVYYNNRLVSWLGRSILSGEELKKRKIPRYKNLSNDKSIVGVKECLYNIDNCSGGVGAMVEGVFDVMRLGDGFFCSLGTQLSEKQVNLITSKFKKLYIMFDNEIEAQTKAKDYAVNLGSLGVKVSVINPYNYYNVNDGGELNAVQAEEIRKELGFIHKN